MTAVSTMDGIKYGFKLMGYQLLVTILSGAVGFAGFMILSIGGAASMRSGSAEASFLTVLVGGAVFLAAAAIWTAGMAGTTYKVVADAVEAGTESATTGLGRTTTSGSGGRASGAEARTGRSGHASGAEARTGRSEGRPRDSSSSSDPTPRKKGSGGSTADWSARDGPSDDDSSAETSVETTRRDASSSRSRSSGGRAGDRGSEPESGGTASGSSRDRSSRRDESRRSDE